MASSEVPPLFSQKSGSTNGPSVENSEWDIPNNWDEAV